MAATKKTWSVDAQGGSEVRIEFSGSFLVHEEDLSLVEQIFSGFQTNCFDYDGRDFSMEAKVVGSETPKSKK